MTCGRFDVRALGGLDDEIADHTKREVEVSIARGISPEEARCQARVAFGNVPRVPREVPAILALNTSS
jgi:hypothetical protein